MPRVYAYTARVERAPDGQAICRHCGVKVLRGESRIRLRVGSRQLFLHVLCIKFAENLIGPPNTIQGDISGDSSVTVEDIFRAKTALEQLGLSSPNSAEVALPSIHPYGTGGAAYPQTQTLSSAVPQSSQIGASSSPLQAVAAVTPKRDPKTPWAMLPRYYAFPESEHVNRECAICLDEFGTNRELTRLPCMCEFHSSCIIPWIDKTGFCPNDRLEVLELLSHGGSVLHSQSPTR
jgi:hypothetical protein